MFFALICPFITFQIIIEFIFNYKSKYIIKNNLSIVDQNSDNELTERSMDEIAQPKHNKLAHKSVQKIEPIESDIMNASNTSVPSESEMCLRWNSHHSNMQTIFPNLLQNERYVDVTLAADGQLIKCHKVGCDIFCE